MSSTSSFPSFSGADSSEHSCNNDAAIAAAETIGAPHATSHKHDTNAKQRPASPVAKTLEEENHTNATLMNDERISEEAAAKNNNNASNIPNLLSSPRNNNRLHSMSPPTIVSSPMAYKNPVISSPTLPAAPPSTPYTPYVSVGGNGNIPALHPPLPLAAVSTSPSSGYTLNHRPSSPLLMMSLTNNTNSTNQTTESTFAQQQQHTQPPNIPPTSPVELLPPQLNPSDAARYNTMLNQALNETSQREKSRIASLTEHEAQNYTTIDEYKHALSRERRHSTSLAMELAQYKFLTRYTSCNVHSADEIDEERRINSLIKNIDNMKRNMNDEKCRVVMELEREEERIINGLMMRLEEVKKEKMLLETQIGNHVQSGTSGAGVVGTGRGGGMVDTEEQRSLHAQFGRMMADQQGQQQQQQMGAAETQQSTTAQQQEAVIIGSELSIDRNSNADNNTMEEDSEDEDEEDYNEDILEGRHHDPEMEEELANLLKMKESK